MKDKEKQINVSTKEEIEEMAKILCGNNCDSCVGSFCLALMLAKTLYKNNYRKIDKDSVVLSMEENAEYLELRNSEIGELVKENRDLGKQCLDWMNLYHKQLTKTKEASKETAEKILNEIWHSKIETTIVVSSKHNKEDIKIACQAVVDGIRDRIRELAKQYGVEIKE